MTDRAAIRLLDEWIEEAGAKYRSYLFDGDANPLENWDRERLAARDRIVRMAMMRMVLERQVLK